MSTATKQHFQLQTLPGINLTLGRSGVPPFERHIHLNYHLGIVFEGAQRFWHKGAHHYLGAQSIASINPDEVHDGQSETEAGYCHGVLQFSNATLKALFPKGPERFFSDSMMHNKALYYRLESIFRCWKNHRALDPEQEILMADSINLLLGALLDATDFYQEPTHKDSVILARVKAKIRTGTLHEPVMAMPLDTLTAQTDWSQYQLIRRFKKHFGMTPYAYQLCLRLEKSKALLTKGHSICDTALAMGFSDQSHFTRCFRRAFFLPPAQYIRQLQ